jgi:hypothetical protein
MIAGLVDKEASDALRATRPKTYRGGQKGGSRSAAAKAADAAGAEVLLMTEDQWDVELVREGLRRLLTIGIKSCSEETLADVCDQVLREWGAGA